MYQKLIVVGNLGNDPEMRYQPDGQAVANFSVAQNNGEKRGTVWFRVTVWGKQAENVNQYLAKGRQVLVEGVLNFDPETGGPKLWTDKNGNTRANFEMTAFTVRFLSGGSAESGNGDSTASDAIDDDLGLEEDDVPF